jgi:hypothetical protein
VLLGILGAIVLGSVQTTGAQSPRNRRKRKVIMDDGSVTNSDEAISAAAGRGQLDSELFKPVTPSLLPANSLNGVLPSDPLLVPENPPVPRKKTREMLQRQKDWQENWVFMKPEDLLIGLTPEEIMQTKTYTADGQEKQKLSPVARYYDESSTRGHKKGDANSNSRSDATEASTGDITKDAFTANRDNTRWGGTSQDSGALLKTDDFIRGVLEPRADAARNTDFLVDSGPQDLQDRAAVRRHDTDSRQDYFRKMIDMEAVSPLSIWDSPKNDVLSGSALASPASSGSTALPDNGLSTAGSGVSAGLPGFPVDSVLHSVGSADQPALPQPAASTRIAPVEQSVLPPKRVF